MRALAQLLRYRDFRWLWLGQTASTIGDRMVVVALALFVSEQTGKATDIGFVLAANTVPLVVLLAIGGVWADRLPRQRIMIAADLARCGLHATLAVLIFAGEAGIGRVVVIEALFGAAEAFFRPAYVGLIPQTVPEHHIQGAQALTSASATVAGFAGPALATTLVVGLGAGWAFAVDAATFLISAAMLLRLRPRQRGKPVLGARLGPDLAAGFREARARAWVWVTIAGFSVLLMVALAPWSVLGPGVANDHYGSTSTFGILAAVIGAGSIAGALLGLRWRPRRPLRAGFIGLATWPVLLIAFGLGAPLAVVVALAAITGVQFAVFDVFWATALAERIPPAVLSRVSSYDWMGSLALIPIGYLAAGPLAAALGASTVLVAGGVAAMLVIALCLIPRETRELGVGPEDAGSLLEASDPALDVSARLSGRRMPRRSASNCAA